MQTHLTSAECHYTYLHSLLVPVICILDNNFLITEYPLISWYSAANSVSSETQEFITALKNPDIYLHSLFFWLKTPVLVFSYASRQDVQWSGGMSPFLPSILGEGERSVSSRSRFTPGKGSPVNIAKEAAWAGPGRGLWWQQKSLLWRKSNCDSPSPSLITTQTALYRQIYFFTIHFNNIPSPTLRISRSLSVKLSDHTFGFISDFLCECYTRSPMQLPLFGHLNEACKEYKLHRSSVFPSLPVTRSSLFVKFKYSSRCFVLHTPTYIFPSES